jgi:hypothetical protein
MQMSPHMLLAPGDVAARLAASATGSRDVRDTTQTIAAATTAASN